MNIEQAIELDAQGVAWLSAYREAKIKIREWTEKADIAGEQIKAIIGEKEIATIDGNPVAKYSVVETHRLDVKRAREILPQQVLDLLEVITPSRRFVLVEGDERIFSLLPEMMLLDSQPNCEASSSIILPMLPGHFSNHWA